MTTTAQATRPVLVSSAVPGANEALATGQAARVAAWHAGNRRGELARRSARKLPEGGRERGWAIANQNRYAQECQDAENDAAALADKYDHLMDRLRDAAPETAAAVDAAVWGSA